MKKKITLGNKLSLNKEVITRLSDDQALEVVGGVGTNHNTCGCQTNWNLEKPSEEEALVGVDSCCKGSC